MAEFDFDLLVIGAGSGGVRAARVAAQHGATVGICEHDRVGGTCVIRGCIPKKLLTYAAGYGAAFDDARAYGWQSGGARFDWPTLIDHKDREIDRLNGVYLRLLDDAGVRLFPERAVFEDPHTLRVGGRALTAATVLIATGDRPVVPPIPGAEHGIVSDDAFHLDRLPARTAVLGAGYIGMEFASIFNGLGSDVSVIYRGKQILRGFDDDLREAVADGLQTGGVDIALGVNVERIERGDGELILHRTDGRRIAVDQCLIATGRSPNTAELGCEAAGVTLDERGAVSVDAWSRTSQPHIHALGDVTDRLPLTPVAIMEGQAFADRVYGGRDAAPDYRNVPTAIFTHPEAASVGLTEAEARRKSGVRVYRARFRALRHTLTGRAGRIMMKLVVDAGTDRVLGCHMVGEDAAEIIQGLAVAVKSGATKAQFDATVGIHPTSAEEYVTMRDPAR